MENNKSDPACLPKEILDITWSNTSEERLKEAYKVWADTYDKVRIYSMSLVYSPCMLILSRQKHWEHEQSGSKWQVERDARIVVSQSLR